MSVSATGAEGAEGVVQEQRGLLRSGGRTGPKREKRTERTREEGTGARKGSGAQSSCQVPHITHPRMFTLNPQNTVKEI
jgi:hypothetical protein